VKPNDPGYMSDPIRARDLSTPAYPVTLDNPRTAHLNERSAINASPAT
jgi:hypothetical protein